MGELRHVDALSGPWATTVLLLVFGVLAWINVTSPKLWRTLWRGITRLRLGRQMMREEVDLRDRHMVVLLLLAVVVMGHFLLQVVHVRSAGAAGALPLVRAVGAVAVVIGGMTLLLRTLAWLFQGDGGTLEYRHTGVILWEVSALVLLPVVLLITYQPAWREELVWTGLALVAALWLLRWVRGVLIGLDAGLKLRYILLYLCAAEVVPLALALNAR